MRRALTLLIALLLTAAAQAQVNTDRVMAIGRNALYFEDYVLSIQYFNQVIRAKPWMAEPYFYRAVAKLNLDDFQGAEEDCTLSLARNPLSAIPSWRRLTTRAALPGKVRRNMLKRLRITRKVWSSSRATGR